MRWGGVILALFVLYHLADLTFGVGRAPPSTPGTSTPTSWRASPAGRWRRFYIVANLALGFHLYHGVWSLFQTLGWNNPVQPLARGASPRSSPSLVAAGNVSFPVAVLIGSG